MTNPKITILCGHYGAGKTNLAVNLGLRSAAAGCRTAVADLDIVNPYFRTADFSTLFQQHSIELVAPLYANSNLDLPVLPPRLASAIGEPGLTLIIDVGGDDDGAVALGGFAKRIADVGYQMLYVVNRSRYLEDDMAEELRLLRAIEGGSRLRVTGLCNNTNLGPETTAALVSDAAGYLDELSVQTGIPVVLTAAPAALCSALEGIPGLLPVEVYVKTPWQE